MNISEILKDIKESVSKIDNIIFVGCGGSLAAQYPAKYLLENQSENLKVGYFSSNEFVHASPNYLGKSSIVITVSHAGETPETVKATKLANEKGAKTISFTWKKDSSLAKEGQYVVIYDWGKDAKVENSKMGKLLFLAFEILNVFENYKNYQQAVDGFDKINLIVQKAKKYSLKRAEKFAENYKDSDIIYVMSSGASTGAAYSYSICILLEMQWINSAAIHSGEYFHGPFEITDKETPFILMINEGRTRPLDERAFSFLSKYGEKLIVLDAKELGLNTIDDTVIEFFNPLLFTNVLRLYAEKLAEKRKHPLSQRRYMWKLEY
ncbi:MAG: hypothetical protein PWQ77_1405 [Kosmotogales bacterium]|nr:hypothetical protein [Kosmotogales bacterium]